MYICLKSSISTWAIICTKTETLAKTASLINNILILLYNLRNNYKRPILYLLNLFITMFTYTKNWLTQIFFINMLLCPSIGYIYIYKYTNYQKTKGN